MTGFGCFFLNSPFCSNIEQWYRNKLIRRNIDAHFSAQRSLVVSATSCSLYYLSIYLYLLYPLSVPICVFWYVSGITSLHNAKYNHRGWLLSKSSLKVKIIIIPISSLVLKANNESNSTKTVVKYISYVFMSLSALTLRQLVAGCGLVYLSRVPDMTPWGS